MDKITHGHIAKQNRSVADGATEAGVGLEVTVPRSVPHLYNNNYTVRLTYADNYRHAVDQYGNAGIAQYFRTNSIFDPDVTGTGHQPIIRDLWASMYDYYSVLSCDYTIRLYNCTGQDPVTYTAVGTSAQVIGATNVTLLRTTDATDITGPATTSGFIYPAAEMKNSSTDMIIPGGTLSFKGTLTPGDYIVDAKDSDSDATWTAMGSNPAVSRYLGYVLNSVNYNALVGANEAPYANIQAQVILDYTVQFTQVNPSLRDAAS